MLAKSKKLHSHEHSLVLKKGKRIHHEFVSLVYRENDLGVTRCAIGVSKKAYRKAVFRNKIRRKLFNFFNETYPQFRLGYDIVLLVQKDLNHLDNESLRVSFNKLIQSLLK